MRLPMRTAAALALAAGLAQAQNDDLGRGVARISVLAGDVSVRRGDSGEWVAAAVNAPLVAQDQVSTGVGSRTELQFDWANLLRLGSNTEVRLSELQYRRYQMQLARGTVTFRVLRDSDAEVEISTPLVSLRPLKKGIYRITVREDGVAEMTARSGEAEIYTTRGIERLRSGRTMMVRGTSADPEFQLVSGIPEDEWDRWNRNRDRDLERSNAYRYVSRDIYGADDLDAHGTWVHAPPYGWVWQPYVAAGWAPYRHGRWSWIDWYGWTWVSYDPWGWAPYHYGRWFWHRNAWCWYPGGMFSRHYWSPALVAFVGFGRVGVGIGFGNVGWVPLAPYEPFYPWWGRGGGWWGGWAGNRNRTYIDNSVNIVNNTNITNIYRNSRVENAVTAVSTDQFGRGRSDQIVRVNNDEMRRASLVRGGLPVTPGTESLRLSDRETAARRSGFDDRSFYSRRTPAAVERATFQEQRAGVERISRRAFGEETGAARESGADSAVRRTESAREAGRGGGLERQGGEVSRRAEPGADAAVRRGGDGARSGGFGDRNEAVRVAESDTGSRGWRRFGDPAGATDARSGQRESTPARGAETGSGDTRSWRRFGEPSSETRTGGAVSEGGTRGAGSEPTWRRFGDGSGRDTTRQEERQGWRSDPRPTDSRGTAAETGRGAATGRESGAWRRFDGAGSDNNSIRVAPPVLHERDRSSDRIGRTDGGARRTESGGAESRPEFVSRPDFGSRPDSGGRSGSGSRPEYGRRPDSGSRPEYGRRPDSGSRPEYRSRPDYGSRPDGGSRPDFGSRPGIGSRPEMGSRDSGARRESYGGGRMEGSRAPSGGGEGGGRVGRLGRER